MNVVVVFGGVFVVGMFYWVIIEIGIYGIIFNIVVIVSNVIVGWLDGKFGLKCVVVLSFISLFFVIIGIILI